VPVPGQGDHGDHRATGRRGRAARAHPPQRRASVGRVAGAPPLLPRRPAQPAVRVPELGVELRHLGSRAPAPPAVPSRLTSTVRLMTADNDTIRARVDAYTAAF